MPQSGLGKEDERRESDGEADVGRKHKGESYDGVVASDPHERSVSASLDEGRERIPERSEVICSRDGDQHVREVQPEVVVEVDGKDD